MSLRSLKCPLYPLTLPEARREWQRSPAYGDIHKQNDECRQSDPPVSFHLVVRPWELDLLPRPGCFHRSGLRNQPASLVSRTGLPDLIPTLDSGLFGKDRGQLVCRLVSSESCDFSQANQL